MSQNNHQVGGVHYQLRSTAGPFNLQHWDFAWILNMDYFQGQITKYICRYRDKGGIQDLKKAQHFLAKYIELLEGDKTPVIDAIPSEADPVRGYKIPVEAAPVDPHEVNPTGWVRFSYEGTDGKGALFTCRKCRGEVRCPHGYFPGYAHMNCPDPAAPTGAYVNQG